MPLGLCALVEDVRTLFQTDNTLTPLAEALRMLMRKHEVLFDSEAEAA